MNRHRVAIVGPATWEPLATCFRHALDAYGLDLDVDTYGFDRQMQLFSGEAEDFERRPPRGVFVFSESRALFGPLLADPRAPLTPRACGREAAEVLVEAIGGVARRHPDVSWVVSTAEDAVPGAADAFADPAMDPFCLAVEEFNRVLCESVRSRPGWSIFDRRRVTARWGTAVVHDPRVELLARYPASMQGMKLLAQRMAAHWAAVCGKMKKVLALDCDNTLWGGVVGEDGVDDIRIGEDGVGRAYAEFQRAVLALEARGALIVLISRNNPADVEEVFARRRDMVIPRDRIAAVEIGWEPKSVGLARLANRLGLGLADFVFVDDNPAEREEVGHALPEVTVADFPADPADLAAFAYDLGWRHFYRVAVREEDRSKTSQYRLRAEFHDQRRAAASRDEFLCSLSMHSVVAVDCPALVARSAQLTQKTNQFNLTLRRYTEAEIGRLIDDPKATVFTAALEDRFGKHGWIALAIFLREQATDGREHWSIDSFLVSCRVLGRSFEQAFAAAAIEQVRAVARLPVRAAYVPGPRNQPAARFFDRLGFELLAEGPDGRREYCLADSPASGPGAIAPGDRLVSFQWEGECIHA